MNYIKNGEYPITEAQIRANHPNTSFPQIIAPSNVIDFGYEPVTPTTPSYDGSVQTATEGTPAKVGDEWQQVWIIASRPKADVQSIKWEQIKQERDRRVVNGIHTAGNWFHSDTFSRTQQLGLVMMGQGMPTGIMWKTMDQTFVEMTPALAQQIFAATAASDSTLFATAEAKHAQMLALDDPAGYDVTTGWPETHA